MGFGTQTPAVAGGGYRGDPGYTAETFEYNGTSWSEGGDLTASPGQAREGHGVLTAGGVVAGYKTSGNAVINNYETYDGTSFTEQADLNTARQDVAATGSTTAALGGGGTTGVGPGSTQEGLTNVESYNGSSWTEITEVNTGRVRAVSFPGAPAPTMIFVGGSSDSTLYANVETYNGSAWTEITDLNTARSTLGGAGQAQTDGIVFGGSAPSKTGATENWNGTTWTELNDLSTARDALANAGTGAASALAAMGYSTQIETVTEEFTAPSTFNQITQGQLFFNSTANAFKETITDFAGAAWASGGNLNTARYNAAGNGLQTAGLMFGGASPGSPGIFDETEEFNGSSWTEKNDLNTGRNRMGGSGTVTAGIAFGGDAPPVTGATERWDGSSWTEVADMNTARGEVAGGGGPAGYTAAIGATGRPSGNNATEIWDGSSWTEVNDTNTSSSVRRRLFGTTTAAIICGGGDTGTQTTVGANTESWDGTSWTEVNNLNSGRFEGAACGIQTAGLFFGGNITPSPGYQKLTESWNGTSWTEVNDLGTARRYQKGAGPNSTAA